MVSAATAKILDFDIHSFASIQQVSSNRQNSGRARAQALHRLGVVLQTTIELPEILHLFFLEAVRVLPLEGLGFVHAPNNLEITEGSLHGHTVHFRLQTRDDYLGEVSFYRQKERFSESELSLLEPLLATLVYPLRNGLRYQEVVRSSLTDALTGAGNRFSLDNVLHRETDLASRYNQPLSVLMLDLDYFKRINDSYGHAAGDYVLKAVAKTLRATSRGVDMTFRYGGEEFVVLLNKTHLEGATVIAERLRNTIANLSVIHDGKEIPVTISVGVAALQKQETTQQFMERADKALYRAKNSGRNRVAVAESKPEQMLGRAEAYDLSHSE
ncbi:conserved hypothetical protein [gamma proteobacterium HdN1]|nr:conserved hypothetical protein [gamma proteobacterium HdN1]